MQTPWFGGFTFGSVFGSFGLVEHLVKIWFFG
jgi:hypothetical protein